LLEHVVVSVLDVLDQKFELGVVRFQYVKLGDSGSSNAILKGIETLLCLIEPSQKDLAGHFYLNEGLKHGALFEQLVQVGDRRDHLVAEFLMRYELVESAA